MPSKNIPAFQNPCSNRKIAAEMALNKKRISGIKKERAYVDLNFSNTRTGFRSWRQLPNFNPSQTQVKN